MPVVGDSSSGLFDLQLSGHTHRGQIFPFRSWCGLSSRMSPGATPCPRAPCST
jgi:predicted MPP superfamily phosphohydrolase